MDANRFTEKAQEAMLGAQQVAEKYNHSQVEVEHLLLALLEQSEGLVPQILQRLGADPNRVRHRVEEELSRFPKVYGTTGQVYMSPSLKVVFDRAIQEAGHLKDEYVSTEHILLAMADDQEKRAAGRILREENISRERIYQVLSTIRGGQRVTDPNPETKYQSLEKYGRDLTALARQGKLDPVIGRDEEIRRVIQVLSRRTKNNPVVIGEPGVGKT
ncbi:MAG: Clp protease N-terminal domain-containing protein, partial [Dehalococcoidia bacterium]|nr:Clp protease N-terminal domain-containing protein [Dehalococcoidia bacterium]